MGHLQRLGERTAAEKKRDHYGGKKHTAEDRGFPECGGIWATQNLRPP